MPRVHHVKKARKTQGSCSCGTEIKPGDPYKWISFMRGPRRVKCANCSFRASELTQGKIGELYGYQEDAYDHLQVWKPEKTEAETALDDAKLVIETLHDNVEQFRDECEESLSNMPEGLQEGDTGQLLQERIDECENWLSEMDNFDPSTFEDWKEDNHPDSPFSDWTSEVEDAVTEVINNCPL